MRGRIEEKSVTILDPKKGKKRENLDGTTYIPSRC
jgi:hypothetical protein